METKQTFDASNKYLRARVNVLNNMSSRELSEQLLPDVRAMSFFSARVAESRVLEKLREVSDRYSAGEMDAATARLEIKNWLKVGDNVKDENIREALMSTSRLDLILDQNQKMAAAVGARELALDPEIYEALPYYRYVPSTSANPRDEHRQFYGIVLDKKDPFWITHTPPLDFGCKCSLDELTATEAGDKVGKATPADPSNQPDQSNWSVNTPDGEVSIDVPESGYVFDVDTALSTCDMSRITDADMRSAIFEQLAEFGKDKSLSFRCIPQFAPLEGASVFSGTVEISEVSDFIAKFNVGTALDASGLKLGAISPALRGAVGMPEGEIVLSSGNKKLFGLVHVALNHKEQLANGEFLKAVEETVFASPGEIRVSVEFRGGQKYFRLLNLKTGAFTSFIESEQGVWELVQAFPRGADYEGYMNIVKAKKKPAKVTGT